MLGASAAGPCGVWAGWVAVEICLIWLWRCCGKAWVLVPGTDHTKAVAYAALCLGHCVSG